MNTKKVYILEDRGILYINGPDSEKFLQNHFRPILIYYDQIDFEILRNLSKNL